MRVLILIIYFLGVSKIALSGDTLTISRKNFLFGRDYGLSLNYLRSFDLKQKNSYGIGYFISNKLNWTDIFDIHYNYDFSSHQLRIGYLHTFRKFFDFREDKSFGINLISRYKDSRVNFLVSPKIGINYGAIDLMLYADLNIMASNIYNSIGIGLTLRPQILLTSRYNGQSWSDGPRYCQYEIKKRRKAVRKGKVFYIH